MQFRVASLLGAALALSARATAQFPVSISLDAKVDASGTVVVGTITSLSRIPEQDSREKLTMVIQVTETLKGAPVKSLTLTTEANSPPQQYLDWQTRRTPILWFADPAPTGGNADAVDRYVQGLTGGPGKRYAPGSPDIVHWAEALDGSGKELHLIDMDFQVLRTEAAVLDRVRRAVKEMPGPHPVTLTPPWHRPEVFKPEPDPSKRPTMHWFTYVPLFLNAHAVYLAMPICPRLERFAQKMIAHPESILPSHVSEESSAERDEEAAKLRAAAIHALVYFKSPGNVELVKGYVNDPYISEGNNGQRIVRDAARWLLAGWGVESNAE